MAKYTGPKCRLSRREGVDLLLKSNIRSLDSKCKADTPPGLFGKRRGRLTDYGGQLRMKQLIKRYYVAAVVFGICVPSAYATATGLPWEAPLEKILDSLTGPVAKILGVIAIVIAGFGIAFGEAGSGMRRIFQIVLGLSIAFTASTLVVTLFGFSGGTAF